MRISDWSSDVCSSDLFDWLSRDAAEVDKYIADPLCGFPITVQAWIDFLDGLEAMARPENQARIPKAMPVLVIAGSLDPVRSEEHTSELQSLMRISYAVFCLKKKNNRTSTLSCHITYDQARHTNITIIIVRSRIP